MTSGERVICESNTVRAFVQRHYPTVPEEKLQVIPRGVDVGQFPRVARADRRPRLALAADYPWLAQVDGPLLLLPGRGTRLKGHAHALQLLADVRAAGVPAQLWMLGTEEPGREAYVADLRRQAAALGVAEAVQISTPTARIALAYAASDLVLQLSDKPEAFGRTVVEALSVGRPVLGWDHGGVGELLQQLQPGGAVPLGDARALGERALALLAQPPSLPTRIPFTLQAMQRDTLRLYADLAG
jgi:glycosyltransferase involved in cell wall biosynthesis